MSQKNRTIPRSPSGHGFDYGIGVTAATVAPMDFNRNLIDADIVAVAYELDYSHKLKKQVPAITLVGRNEVPLKKAFEEFSDWASSTDADAIELTIVIKRDGGYRVCINPETDALYKRAFQYDTVLNPMTFQITWIKVFDTTSPYLTDLRKHLSAGTVRPFLLRPARFDGILLDDRQALPGLMEPIPHSEELLKFDLRFVDEGSPYDLDWQRIALGGAGVERKQALAPRNIPKSIVWNRRKESLKTLFPVTLWTSRSCDQAIALRWGAGKQGLQDWQIDQAICNLVVSREVANGKIYFQGCSGNDWPDRLWRALRNRFEMAGGDRAGFDQLTVENVVRQAIFDARVLLRHYGVKAPVQTKLKRVQYLLRQHSLLDAPEE